MASMETLVRGKRVASVTGGLALGAVLAVCVGSSEAYVPVAWIHLSETPIDSDDSDLSRDRYFGDGPEVFAYLAVDGVDGGFVAAAEVALWTTGADGAVLIDDFKPLDGWRLDPAPVGRLDEFPSLPGHPTPAVVGYWRLQLLRGRASRLQLQLGADSSRGLRTPLVIAESGRAVPLALLRGAGINTRPPGAVSFSPDVTPARLFWATNPVTTDLVDFPSARAQCGFPLRLSIACPGLVREGSVGIAVSDADGPIDDWIFYLGGSGGPASGTHAWIEQPPGWPASTRSTALGFRRRDGGPLDELLLDIPLSVPGADRGVSVRIPWVVLRNPGGAVDTLWPDEPTCHATALGGALGPTLVGHAWGPACVTSEVPFRLRILGQELQRISRVVADGDGGAHEASHLAVSRNGRLLRAEFPCGIPGPAHCRIVLQADDRGATHLPGTLTVQADSQGPEGLGSAPAWFADPAAVDADYLIVTTAEHDLHLEAADYASEIELLTPFRPIVIPLQEIQQVYWGMPDSAAIKQALAFAYTHWKSAPLLTLLHGNASEYDPSWDLIPTPHVFQDCGEALWCDGSFAMDMWYGDVVADQENATEIAVGRLPSNLYGDLSAYTAKVVSHFSPQSIPDPVVKFVVGDAPAYSIDGYLNRRYAAQRIMRQIESSAVIDTAAIYARDFVALDADPLHFSPEEIVAGRDAVVGFLNEGRPGVVEFFGNTNPAHELVYLLRYDNPPNTPQFRASMLANEAPFPVMVLSHCKTGAFDEYETLEWAPVEDFVLGSEHGAIAAVGKGQLTYLESDEGIANAVYDVLCAGSGGSCVGFAVASARDSYLSSQACSRVEAEWNGAMLNLVGDPCMPTPTLGPAHTLVGSFETGGAFPFQNRFASRASWTSSSISTECSFSRVVHGGVQRSCCGSELVEQVFPPGGSQRMFQVCGAHEVTGEPAYAAWTVLATYPRSWPGMTAMVLEPNRAETAVLSYWVRQDKAGAGEEAPGRLTVDLIASDGRVASNYGAEHLCDQWARPFSLDDMEIPVGQWTHMWVRLSDWARSGVGVDSVIVRYRDADGAVACGFIDDVFVGSLRDGCVSVAGNVILNGEFSIDRDGDHRADFWTGRHLDLEHSLGGLMSPEGPGEVALIEAEPAFRCISQVLPRVASYPRYAIGLHARGGEELDNLLAIRLWDLDSQQIASETVFPIAEIEEEHVVLLDAAPGGRHLLELEALSGVLWISSVWASEWAATSVPVIEETAQADVFFSILPRPGSLPLVLRVGDVMPRRWDARLLDIEGRVALGSTFYSRQGEVEVVLAGADASPSSLRSGIYFLQLQSGRLRHTERLVVVR